MLIRYALVATAILVVLMIAGVWGAKWAFDAGYQKNLDQELGRYEACIQNERTLSDRLEDLKTRYTAMTIAAEYCQLKQKNFWRIYDEHIAKEAYIRQGFSNQVIMWMVVFLTVAGVALSVIQLWTSHQLARRGITIPDEQHELTIENGKIAFRSSMIGAVILVISFMFFSVFISDVYKIEVINGPGTGKEAAEKDEQSGKEALPTASTEQ